MRHITPMLLAHATALMSCGMAFAQDPLSSGNGAEESRAQEEKAAEAHESSNHVPAPTVDIPIPSAKDVLLNENDPPPQGDDNESQSETIIHPPFSAPETEEISQISPISPENIANWISFTSLLVSAGTLYLFSRTAKYARNTWDAAKAANTLQEDALRLAERASNAAADSAAAALKSADAAIQMAQADRAWLIFSLEEYHEGPSNQVVFRIINRGRTPAILSGVAAEMYWVQEQFTGLINFIPEEEAALRHRSIKRPSLHVRHPPNKGAPRLVRIPEINDTEGSISRAQGVDFVISPDEGMLIMAKFKRPYPLADTAIDRANESLYIHLRAFYEDMRGISGETSIYRMVNAGGGFTDLTDEDLRKKHNYRK